MANTYQFKIKTVECHVQKDGLSDIIYNVHWSYYAMHESFVESENDNRVYMIGTMDLAEPDPENFLDFDQITEDQVVSWIEPKLDIESMRSYLDGLLAEKVTPTKVTKTLGQTLQSENVDKQEAAQSESTEQVEGQESAATEETTEETAS
jgi:hypothetical protein